MASLVDMGWNVITSTSAVTVNPHDNAVSCDVVVIGGGAGGKGNSPATLAYGNAGSWNSGTLPPAAFTVKAGVGGERSASSHRSGTASTAGSITGSGGSGGSVSVSVSNAGSYTAFGATFTGGGPAAPNSDGKVPGGGGGGSNIGSSTLGYGARGQVWYRWWTNPKIQNLYIGGKEVQAVYVGSKEVTAVYSGNKLVYGVA